MFRPKASSIIYTIYYIYTKWIKFNKKYITKLQLPFSAENTKKYVVYVYHLKKLLFIVLGNIF